MDSVETARRPGDARFHQLVDTAGAQDQTILAPGGIQRFRLVRQRPPNRRRAVDAEHLPAPATDLAQRSHAAMTTHGSHHDVSLSRPGSDADECRFQ